LLAALGHL